ncbi:PREDICTED: uncharacterized protein CG13380 [Dinoponera quadriceps]|uniref:Uncharacterized protein CG13380 n=1 Tax=Dinoponera quadriceps TaxID=609295 RepID=A0A6P3XH92_DINQU|nr:PREDICTED: uncharacterized protein CG13380 [Dinoponera quadriceps]
MDSKFLNKNDMMRSQKDNPSMSSDCICYRPHSNIICNRCGFWIKGRVRYYCPQHPKIVFLHDHHQCPRCKSYDFMLTEI